MSHVFNSTGYPMYAADIVRGSGCYVYDRSGKPYLDLESGVWALPLGHCDPDVNNAMHRQIDEMMHSGYKYSQPIVERCAEKLLEISHFDDGGCVFLTSGSEAVEYGVQLANALRPGKHTLCLKGQYLSAYGLCAQRDKGSWEAIEWDAHDRQTADDWYDRINHQFDFSQIGVFVFEPGNTSGLTKLPPDNLVAALSRLTEEHHVITVADEVTCGIGRTGKWFGFMHYSIKPDIIAAGKGIGNGYPVSAVIMNGRTVRNAGKSDFHFAQSHQNDPMGCSVIYEVLTKIEREDLLDNAVNMGNHLRNRYAQMQRALPVITEIRGRGLLTSVELSASVTGQTLLQADRLLFERGFIVGVNPRMSVIRTYCPLIVTADMIDRYISALTSVLQELIL